MKTYRIYDVFQNAVVSKKARNKPFKIDEVFFIKPLDINGKKAKREAQYLVLGVLDNTVYAYNANYKAIINKIDVELNQVEKQKADKE